MAIASINAAKAAHRRQFGTALREAREAAGFGQVELAARLGLTQTSVSNWESGKTSPSEANLAALDRVGLTIGDLSDEARSKTTKTGTLTIRLRDSLRSEMERVASAGPYPISFTAIVERGILLAVAELDEIADRAKKVGGAR